MGVVSSTESGVDNFFRHEDAFSHLGSSVSNFSLNLETTKKMGAMGASSSVRNMSFFFESPLSPIVKAAPRTSDSVSSTTFHHDSIYAIGDALPENCQENAVKSLSVNEDRNSYGTKYISSANKAAAVVAPAAAPMSKQTVPTNNRAINSDGGDSNSCSPNHQSLRIQETHNSSLLHLRKKASPLSWYDEQDGGDDEKECVPTDDDDDDITKRMSTVPNNEKVDSTSNWVDEDDCVGGDIDHNDDEKMLLTSGRIHNTKADMVFEL
jgi:hypothetical protein